MELNVKYKKITPQDVFYGILRHEMYKRHPENDVAPNEWGNLPTGNDFIDLFAGYLNRMGNLDVKDIAHRMGVDKLDMLHSVRAMTGLWPRQWTEEFMTLRACELLDKSSLSSVRISQELGFSSPAAFNRFFKRVMKQTPGQWRRANKTSGRNH